MNIKKAIIKTNDVLAYIAFAAVLIIGLVDLAGLGQLDFIQAGL